MDDHNNNFRGNLTGLRHVGIVLDDLDKGIQFYRDILGLKVVKKMYESGEYLDKVLSLKQVKIVTVKMAAQDGTIIELLHFDNYPSEAINPRRVNDPGISHIAFTVDNLQAKYEELIMKGVFFNSSPQCSPDGYAKVAFCKDKEGNIIELVEVLKK